MIIQINKDLCLGCGICMDVCQSGAIFMDAHRAVIDFDLCNICEVCIEVCPNEAIAAIAGSPQVTSIPIPNTVNIPANRIVSRPEQTDTTVTLTENKPFTKAAVSFLGSEFAPRLVDMAISVLDRKLTQSKPSINTLLNAPLQNRPENVKMKRRRIRSHGESGKGRKFVD